jgi:SAM-dependent methyltransferase
MITNWHRRVIEPERRQALACLIGEAIVAGVGVPQSILDVGCGDGGLSSEIARRFGEQCPVEGVETFQRRGKEKVKVTSFNGKDIPFEDKTFDVVILCDVLHHVPTVRGQKRLFDECLRVCRRGLVVKDHTEKWLSDRVVLTAMDLAGNFCQGVSSPCNYLDRQRWEGFCRDADVHRAFRREAPLGLHGEMFSWLTEETPWGSKLQFIEFLRKNGGDVESAGGHLKLPA